MCSLSLVLFLFILELPSGDYCCPIISSCCEFNDYFFANLEALSYSFGGPVIFGFIVAALLLTIVLMCCCCCCCCCCRKSTAGVGFSSAWPLPREHFGFSSAWPLPREHFGFSSAWKLQKAFDDKMPIFLSFFFAKTTYFSECIKKTIDFCCNTRRVYEHRQDVMARSYKFAVCKQLKITIYERFALNIIIG